MSVHDEPSAFDDTAPAGTARSDTSVPKASPRANGHDPGVSLADFHAYMPRHNYIYEPTRTPWPASSVNSRIPPIPLTDDRGEPIRDGDGKQVVQSASAWLDRHKPVEQMTWAPG